MGAFNTPDLKGLALAAARRGLERIEKAAGPGSAPTPMTRAAITTPAATPFQQAATAALATAATNGGSVSVIAISLDYFDVLRSSHGAEAASSVASTAANRITKIVRLQDAIIASGDDGFAVLWAPHPGAPDAQEIATRIARQFEQPMMTPTGQISVTSSIGIATAEGSVCATVTPATLQRQARSAVLSAQREGRAQLRVFDRAIQDQAFESYQTERHLRSAVHAERLGVDFQPIVSLHSGEVVAVEALARWNHDVLGIVSPNTFIPIAEEAGLIGELGRSVLRCAVDQAGAWNRDPQKPSPLVSVNLSNRQLLDPELIPAIKSLLDRGDLMPQQLCMEITESVVMSDVAASMTILGHMKDLGLRLAIDDFGTGYSSLSYLRRLPVDIIKIDQSFVQAVYNRDDRMITKAIIDLAHTLGMTTVAEGVETRLQVEVLHALNCDMAQGFYLQAPTGPAEINFAKINFEDSFTESLGLPSAPTTAGASSFLQSR